MLPYQQYFFFSCLAVGVAGVISSAEHLHSISLFREDGILSWRVLQTAFISKKPLLGEPLKQTVFHWKGVRLVLTIRLLLSVLLPVISDRGTAASLVLVGLLLSQLFISYRAVFGSDGSDQMFTILCAGLIPFYLFSINHQMPAAGFYFIALQSVLSYFTAGVAKAISPAWHSGEALPAIVNTATYGHRGFADVLEKRIVVSSLLCWAVIVFECLFPLVLIAPKWLLIAFLAIGVSFHIGNAAVMGLNVFLWSFLGTYPAIILVNAQMRTLLHLN